MTEPKDNQPGQISSSVSPTRGVAVTVHSGAVSFYNISEEKLDQLVAGTNVLSATLATTFLGLSAAFLLSWLTGCTDNIGEGVIPTLAIVFMLFAIGFGISAAKGTYAKRKQVRIFKDGNP